MPFTQSVGIVVPQVDGVCFDSEIVPGAALFFLADRWRVNSPDSIPGKKPSALSPDESA